MRVFQLNTFCGEKSTGRIHCRCKAHINPPLGKR